MEENKHNNSNPLRDRRRFLRLSQSQVARIVGPIDPSLVSRYERGLSIPTLEIALKLATLFQLPIAKLFPDLSERTKVEVLEHDTERDPAPQRVFIAAEEAA